MHGLKFQGLYSKFMPKCCYPNEGIIFSSARVCVRCGSPNTQIGTTNEGLISWSCFSTLSKKKFLTIYQGILTTYFTTYTPFGRTTQTLISAANLFRLYCFGAFKLGLGCIC